MTSLFNLIWFIFAGWFQGLIFLLLGCLFYITVVGIPIGNSLFELAKLIAFPFGKTIVKNDEMGGVSKAGHSVLNLLWLPFGIIISLSCLLIAIPLFIGIITIPIAIVYVRVAKFAFSPFGIHVITQKEATARRTAEIMLEKQGKSSVGNPPSTGNVSKENVNPREELSAVLDESKKAFVDAKNWIASKLTPEKKARIRAFCADFRKAQKVYVTDARLLSEIAVIAGIFVVAFIAYSHFHEPEYFVGKDVSLDNTKRVWTIDSHKPVSGKVIFKKDGDVLLSYATVINGYVDTTFETYPSGKPKLEAHTTYDWNKDTKSEYAKEWYEDGKMKRYDRFEKNEQWYSNGQKSLESENYIGPSDGRDTDSTRMSHIWADDGKMLSETKYSGRLILSETKFTYNFEGGPNVDAFLEKKETDFYSGSKKSKTITESFYQNGKTRKYSISGELEQEGYENGDKKSIVDIATGSGTTFYPGNLIKEHTESGSYLKTGYFENGKVAYDYVGQVGKTFDESGSLFEECKKVAVQKEVPDCGAYFCVGKKTVQSESVRCFDGSGALLYEPPSSLGWKSLKSVSELRELSKSKSALETKDAPKPENVIDIANLLNH